MLWYGLRCFWTILDVWTILLGAAVHQSLWNLRIFGGSGMGIFLYLPHKRVKSQIFVYFCQNASECPDIVSQPYLECCESISELIVMLQTLFRSASAQNRQTMAGKWLILLILGYLLFVVSTLINSHLYVNCWEYFYLVGSHYAESSPFATNCPSLLRSK